MKTASPSAQHKWQTWPSAVKVCCSVKQARTRLITHKWSSRPVMFIKQDGAPPKDTPSATQQTPSIPGQPLPPTPAAAVGAVVQTQQHRVKSGMQQLAGSLSSSNANLCHAALQQMQDALLSMYTSNAANTQVLHMAGMLCSAKLGPAITWGAFQDAHTYEQPLHVCSAAYCICVLCEFTLLHHCTSLL